MLIILVLFITATLKQLTYLKKSVREDRGYI